MEAVAISPARREKIMAEILKRRGRPTATTLRSFVKEYYTRIVREQYPATGADAVRATMLEVCMDIFDEDAGAYRRLFTAL